MIRWWLCLDHQSFCDHLSWISWQFLTLIMSLQSPECHEALFWSLTITEQCCPRWQFDNLADNNQYLQTLTIQPFLNLASDNGKHFFSRQHCVVFPACLGLGSSEYAGQDCCGWCQTVKGKMTNGSRCSENESWQRFCWISAKLFGGNETQNILVRSAKNIWMLSVNNTRSSTGW